MPWPVVPVHRPVPARVGVSRGSSVTAPSVRDGRIAGGPLPGTGSLLTFQSPDWSVSARSGFGNPLPVCWFPCFRNTVTARQRRHRRLSSTASQAPPTILELPGSQGFRLGPLEAAVCCPSHAAGSLSKTPCCAPRLLVVRVFSSTLLPGFLGPESSVLPVNLPPSVPSSLRGLLVESVCCCLWQHQQQDRRASLGKTPHLPRSRPASRRVDHSGYQASRIHACSAFSPTPSSRFAVRDVPGFCLMLPPDIPFLKMPLPCWRSLSVR